MTTGVSFRWGKRLEGLIAGLSNRLDAYDVAAAEAKAKRDERWIEINYRVARAEAKAMEAKEQARRVMRTAAITRAPDAPFSSYFDRAEIRDLKDRMDKVEARLDRGASRVFAQGMFVGAGALLAGMFFGLYLFK